MCYNFDLHLIIIINVVYSWHDHLSLHDICTGYELTPYYSSPNQVIEKLKNGERLPEPQYCPSNVYSIVMRRCWAENPNERIKFEEARDNLICVSFFTRELKRMSLGAEYTTIEFFMCIS